MASSREYLEFILEQLSGLDDISYRAMMGEYIIDMFDNPPDMSMKMPISSPFSYAEVGLSNMSNLLPREDRRRDI